MGRPVKRRSVIASAAIVALPLGLLGSGFILAIFLMILGEDTWFFGDWGTLATVSAFWVFWAGVFYRQYSADDPVALTSVMTRWLMRGSVLELVVAVPSHVISRQRNECCAPGATLLLIATGLSVALMSFGPGLYFLFAKRIGDKKKAASRL